MASKYSISISLYPGGVATLDSIRIDATDYPLGPFLLDSNDASLALAVRAELNALGFGNIFSVIQGADFLNITTICAIQEVESVSIDSGSMEEFAFDAEACVAPTITIDLTIDCDNLTCLTFKDTTKVYSSSNTTGYGTPNYPGIADITSVLFSIVDVNGVDWQFEDSGYLPTAAGTNTICLTAANFLSYTEPIVFVGNGHYRLYYTLNLANGDTLEKFVDFVFPCCGAAAESNLGTNYTITEKLGCGSIDFKDTTGTYNASTNAGGYGFPNQAYSDIISTIIKITRADGTIIQITDFIPTLANQTKNITAATLGYSDGVIVPQVMKVEYSVFTAGNCRVGYKSLKILFHCFLRNCIVSKGKSLIVQACSNACDDSERKNIIALMLRYEMMLLASYDNIECIENEVAILYKECKKYCGC